MDSSQTSESSEGELERQTRGRKRSWVGHDYECKYIYLPRNLHYPRHSSHPHPPLPPPHPCPHPHPSPPSSPILTYLPILCLLLHLPISLHHPPHTPHPTTPHSPPLFISLLSLVFCSCPYVSAFPLLLSNFSLLPFLPESPPSLLHSPFISRIVPSDHSFLFLSQLAPVKCLSGSDSDYYPPTKRSAGGMNPDPIQSSHSPFSQLQVQGNLLADLLCNIPDVDILPLSNITDTLTPTRLAGTHSLMHYM